VKSVSDQNKSAERGEVLEERSERRNERRVVDENKFLEGGREGEGWRERKRGVVEAIVEEEFAKVGEGGEEMKVEGGVRGAWRVGGFVGNVAEAELNDVGRLVELRWVVANDAVWGGEAEVVGVEGAPGNGGVEGVENVVE